MKLELQNLSKNYKDKCAVNSISMELTVGVYGLIGANGAGKTTLMKMICGLINPTKGSVLFNGENIQIMGKEYYKRIGYLPQDFGYYPEFVAKEFLMYIACLKGLTKNEAKSKVTELLKKTTLWEVRNKKIKGFSGGMKRRLGIAQSVLNNPNIIVLDEPTAGLDPTERVRFKNLISDFAKDNIVLLSTHITSDVESIANKIFVVKDGEILLEGSINELKERVHGKVWECNVKSKDIDYYIDNFNIVNLKNEQEYNSLRVVSDVMPHKDAKNLEPSLEDLYLYYFPNSELKGEGGKSK